MTDEADAIVVGSGINGLVAAAELAPAGWSVILLERDAKIGGFIAAEERTLPGYLHDSFSSWHPLFVSGPAYAALGELLDPERTAAEFAHAEDRSAYLAMLKRLGENMASIGGLLGSEVRSPAMVRYAIGLVRSGGLRGAEWWLRAAVTSGRAYLRRDFRGHEVDHLYAPWLLHAGLCPDHAAGGLMTPLFAGILHGFGLPVVAGGAGRFLAAFGSLLDSLAVRVETNVDVDRILVARGRAIDVLTPDDLRDRNPNAVSGDPYGGSAELDQTLLWRPLASSGRHATPVRRLWHIGASTHPGAGLGGGSGHLVATRLTRRRAWQR
jgi:phytoene dehydrogenase-like protein